MQAIVKYRELRTLPKVRRYPHLQITAVDHGSIDESLTTREVRSRHANTTWPHSGTSCKRPIAHDGGPHPDTGHHCQPRLRVRS